MIPLVGHIHIRLSKLIENVGWDTAKEQFPEVRRILQHVGQSVREHDPNYWVRVLMANMTDGHIVVTDVRYRNEHDALVRLGFRTVRIIRPSVEEMTHRSETDLESVPTNLRIVNNRTVSDLHAHVDTLPF
ncbi:MULTISPECIES: deoxynucleotide monophosphate kinase family protein [unclassified Streptomyces]|uniref:deoxynucleotide monophosphate kinase family protein n=1 Tax=Streptomyces sp. NPDC056835 TaxID=3345956 RepID=UPI003677A02A